MNRIFGVDAYLSVMQRNLMISIRRWGYFKLADQLVLIVHLNFADKLLECLLLCLEYVDGFL